MNNKIYVAVIEEAGYAQAMFGMGLSFGLCSGMSFGQFVSEETAIKDRMAGVFNNNSAKDGGHNKFLESMQIWLDVDAPRFWWSEADTYRVGSSKQSESTMHTLVKQIKGIDFIKNVDAYVACHFDCRPEDESTITEVLCHMHNVVNDTKLNDIEKLTIVKGLLPESFMQRRIWNINYKVLRNIVLQRRNHRLPHWNKFIDNVLSQIDYPELITEKLTQFGNLKLN